MSMQPRGELVNTSSQLVQEKARIRELLWLANIIIMCLSCAWYVHRCEILYYAGGSTWSGAIPWNISD